MRAWMGSLAVGCLLAACLGGCNRLEQPSTANRQPQDVLGTVAIIDLDVVAQKLGRDKTMSEAIQQHEAALNQQLANIKVSYEKEISEKQNQFGQSPSQEQVQLLSNMGRQASANLTQVQQKAKNDLSQHRAQLVQQFRDEVKPIARQVASDKGLSIIVTKNETVVFDFTSAVDITEDVIRKTRERPTTPGGAVGQ
jgi:Skp family chaperone for outer membrane proteins